MAASDPKRLHWPPISALWQFLYNLRNGTATDATPASGQLQILQKYVHWLSRGLSGWQPPSAEAGKALDAASERPLDFGEEKVTVYPALLPAVKVLSAQIVRTLTVLSVPVLCDRRQNVSNPTLGRIESPIPPIPINTRG